MTRTDHVEINGVTYEIFITYKRVKNIHFRYRNDRFEVTCSFFTSLKVIRQFLVKNGESLIKKNTKAAAVTDTEIYIFGKKYVLASPISDEELQLDFYDKDELNKKLKALLKDYIDERLQYYFPLMGINESYKVRIRDNSRILGSNSRTTLTLSFSSNLVHYSKEIIDSVIVHECAHCFVFNHSEDFYDIVYKYFPNYNLCRKKLINSIFA